MFLFHTAFSTGMVALAAGTALYVWSIRNEGKGTELAKLIGFLVIIFSIISSLCASYYAVIYWQAGYFQTPNGMSASSSMGMSGGMMSESMMNSCMMECKKNMSGGMMEMNSMKNQPVSNSAQNHAAHHQQ